MSRVAKMPINLPKGIEVNLTADTISIKGPKGNLSHVIHPQVKVAKNSDVLEVTPAMRRQRLTLWQEQPGP